ncbi:MAG: hypothetical protein IJA10_01200 [Lachnospiraceae bacterium]|nr:hypothetical protein [Lachnospiraceae bacterium]
MNENLVMEEDTIYEVDPVCMKKKEKEKNNRKVEGQEPMKKAEHFEGSHSTMFLCILILLLILK